MGEEEPLLEGVPGDPKPFGKPGELMGEPVGEIKTMLKETRVRNVINDWPEENRRPNKLLQLGNRCVNKTRSDFG